MDEEEEYCGWCGQRIYEDEERCTIAAYDEGEHIIGHDFVCYDCWDGWYCL